MRSLLPQFTACCLQTVSSPATQVAATAVRIARAQEQGVAPSVYNISLYIRVSSEISVSPDTSQHMWRLLAPAELTPS